jgi:D-glycero-D-manno-heptose 1,7-bisphosphate phosphatase
MAGDPPPPNRSMTRRRAVFLDRDGVLNEPVDRGGVSRSPAALDEFRLTPGASAALDPLRDSFLLVVVSNQPEIARGSITSAAVDAMHDLLRRELRVDAAYYCPHDNADGCDCRKPAPGLLRRAADDLQIDLAGSWMIGDRWVDVAAAVAAGVRPVLLDHPRSWATTSAGTPGSELRERVVASSATLSGCVQAIVDAEEVGSAQR